MNQYELFTKIYGYTHNYPGIHQNVLTPVRRLLRSSATKLLPKYFASHPAQLSQKRREDVIVSLTSFPSRIGYVGLTIESLLRQTILPRHIVLWLSTEQFPTVETIPIQLRLLQNEVFIIRYVEGNIRSHKKYFYSMSEFPNCTIVTVDDDIIYPPIILEELMDVAMEFPGCIVANVARTLSYSEGILDSYKSWECAKPFTRVDNVQIGAGGVWYPPNSLFEDCLKLELSQELAPSVDDLWLNAMARLKGTNIVKTSFNSELLPIIIPKNEKLTTINVQGNMNDEQLQKIRDYYSHTELGDPYQPLTK